MSGLIVALAAALQAVAAAQRLEPSGQRVPVTALAVTPDGSALLRASQHGVSIHLAWWRFSLATKLEQVHALAFSPDGRRLAVGGGSPAERGLIELWSWPRARLEATLTGHADVVYDLAWCDDGTVLASASGDRTVKLWNVFHGKAERTLEGHSAPVLCLAVSPERRLLCSGGVDQTIRVWELPSGRLLRVMDNHLDAVQALAFRPALAKAGPVILASGGADRTVRIWQPAIGRMVRIIRHPAAVHALVWRPDGTELYSGAADGWVRTLDADQGEVRSAASHGQEWIMALAVWRGQVVSTANGKR